MLAVLMAVAKAHMGEKMYLQMKVMFLGPLDLAISIISHPR